jgi:hypothetical protein
MRQSDVAGTEKGKIPRSKLKVQKKFQRTFSKAIGLFTLHDPWTCSLEFILSFELNLELRKFRLDNTRSLISLRS